MSKSYTKEQVKKLESELKTVTEERDYLKQCCINAGLELSRYSFKMVCNVWGLLSEEERQQIKEALE